ncbi:MAG TPA: CopG family transcriptional regulator [Bryobacteraceae bacterium]|nr:CopG family transcriptional regulator [Bryobacteraceae bacterium]
MSHRLQVLVPEELDAQLEKAAQRSRMSKGAWVRLTLKEALKRSGHFPNDDSVARLASLDAPTADIDQMLAEIEAGRV